MWKSEYTDYQEFLYQKICDFKEDILTPIGYRKISQILIKEGFVTPRNTIFTPSKVFSIYKKGKRCEERMNRVDKIEISDVEIEVVKNNLYQLSITHPELVMGIQ